MKTQHLLLSLVLAAFGLSPMTAAAAEKDKPATASQRLKERQAPRAKKAPPKKTQKRLRPSASPKAGAKPVAKAVPGPRVSTDTESRITRAGDHNFSIQHGGLARTYRVHVPARYDPATPAPLLVALHGSGRSMEDQANDSYFGLAAKSEREGFIAVFPGAYGKPGDAGPAAWNAGNCCGSARDQKVDDVGFIRQVVTNVFRQLSVDRDRIYATGMSSGAMMAYRLACELPAIFRAVAPVAGTDNTVACTPGAPVSVLHLHAKNDSNVPFAGGTVQDASDRARATAFTSVPETVAKWVKLNGCSATPRRILDKAGAYCEAHSWCEGQAEVQLCVTDSGGHSWPGAKKPAGGDSPSQALSAPDVMWTFFNRH
jgi:polyhydroxybutyrate depolymerase